MRDKQLKTLLSEIQEKREGDIDTDLIKKAYNYAKEKHEGQRRKNGDPFFLHPLTVAMRVAEFDDVTICSALLHDVVEDTTTSHEDICNEFGKEIAYVVLGLTDKKSSSTSRMISYYFREINQRKLVSQSNEDERILIVRLSDRLNNLETIDGLRRESKKKMIMETLGFLIPLAKRKGISAFISELEELGMMILYELERQPLIDEEIRRMTRFQKEMTAHKGRRDSREGQPSDNWSIFSIK